MCARLLDRERNQPLEIEAIVGTPFRRAREKGLNVPHLQSMYDQINRINPISKLEQS